MPITILDKSAFQCFSLEEHIYFKNHFFHNITPILLYEIYADLAKTFKKGEIPFKKVVELSSKFMGSGNPVNTDYRKLCTNSLIGYRIHIGKGQAVIDYGTKVPLNNGKFGMFIDLSPLNKAILRWSDGNFTDSDKLLAELWRKVSNKYTSDVFKQQIDELQIILPRVNEFNEIQDVVNEYMMKLSLQDSWLNLSINLVNPANHIKNKILFRWNSENTLLKYFAPYAYFCIKVILTMQIATSSGLIKWKSTNRLDMEYLFYLPFCMLFVSGDNLHIQLAPLLMRENQSFANSMELKKSMKMQIEQWKTIDKEEKLLLKAGLGSYPLPMKDSIIINLWNKHCIAWDRWNKIFPEGTDKDEKERILNYLSKLISEKQNKF